MVGHGAVSGGVDWKQEKLKSSGTTSTDVYKRDTTGLYLTGQQQIDSVTLEASGREDHDEQFGWHGTGRRPQAGNLSTVIGQRSRTAQDSSPSLGQQYGAERFGIASNPNLKPEESKQWEAGLEGLTAGRLALSAYRYEIQNLIDYDNNAYYNVKSATIKGLEWTGI